MDFNFSILLFYYIFLEITMDKCTKLVRFYCVICTICLFRAFGYPNSSSRFQSPESPAKSITFSKDIGNNALSSFSTSLRTLSIQSANSRCGSKYLHTTKNAAKSRLPCR